MGRQFSYYCCPSDLAQVEAEVFRPLGGTLICTEERDGGTVIVPVTSFALPLERMGTDTLFLYLQPPEELRKLSFAGSWLDSTRSHLIEVGRSYIQSGHIGMARFWVETRFPDGGDFVNKPQAFVSWASSVFRLTKRCLERHTVQRDGHTYIEWFGKAAWRQVSDGNLAVS